MPFTVNERGSKRSSPWPGKIERAACTRHFVLAKDIEMERYPVRDPMSNHETLLSNLLKSSGQL